LLSLISLHGEYAEHLCDTNYDVRSHNDVISLINAFFASYPHFTFDLFGTLQFHKFGDIIVKPSMAEPNDNILAFLSRSVTRVFESLSESSSSEVNEGISVHHDFVCDSSDAEDDVTVEDQAADVQAACLFLTTKLCLRDFQKNLFLLSHRLCLLKNQGQGFLYHLQTQCC